MQLRNFGINFDEFRDFMPQLTSWIIKFLALGFLSYDADDYFVVLYTIMSLYVTVEIFMALSYIILVKVKHFRSELE